MTEADAANILRDMIIVTIKVAGPILITAMIVGLIIAILQTTTSIQEQTLTFVPKLIAIVIVLMIFAGYYIQTLIDYTQELFATIGRL